MSDAIEIVSDGDGALIFGDEDAIQEFSAQYGLTEWAQKVSLDRLSRWLRLGFEATNRISRIAQQSGMYVKLTPESFEALNKAGGLMPTATKGVSHLMLGKTGDRSLKWLQADTSASALIGNPAVLSGVSGLLASFSQQLEAKELNEFMARVDARLNEVLINQRNQTLADIETAAEQIEDALALLESDGDPQTIWELVRSADDRIVTVQNKALKNLGSVADSAKQADSTKEIKKLSQEVEGKVNLWLSVLARCFELKDRFNVIELDHVMMTAPAKYDGHRKGLAKNRERRRHKVIGQTSSVLAALDKAGTLAVGRTIIHPSVAKRLISAINTTAGEIDSFHKPLGINENHPKLEPLPWREAWKDPDQVKEAAKSAGKGALPIVSTVGVVSTVGARLVAQKSGVIKKVIIYLLKTLK